MIMNGMNSKVTVHSIAVIDDIEEEGSIMQCCDILDVEGIMVSVEEKLAQALHGIYLPHTVVQHRSLSIHFPSHLYLAETHIEECTNDLTRIPYNDAGFVNDFEFDCLSQSIFLRLLWVFLPRSREQENFLKRLDALNDETVSWKVCWT